jgi:hypothetical protein
MREDSRLPTPSMEDVRSRDIFDFTLLVAKRAFLELPLSHRNGFSGVPKDAKYFCIHEWSDKKAVNAIVIK